MIAPEIAHSVGLVLGYLQASREAMLDGFAEGLDLGRRKGIVSPEALPLPTGFIPCPKCQKPCSGPSGLKKHEWWSHRRAANESEHKMEPLDSHREPVEEKCPDCSFKTKSVQAMVWHKKKKHAPPSLTADESRLLDQSSVHFAESEAKVLLALRAGDFTVDGLLAKVKTPARTMRYAVKGLEDKGFVRHLPNWKGDLRISVFSLTSNGIKLLRDLNLGN